jgi:hypothetical protein
MAYLGTLKDIVNEVLPHVDESKVETVEGTVDPAVDRIKSYVNLTLEDLFFSRHRWSWATLVQTVSLTPGKAYYNPLTEEGGLDKATNLNKIYSAILSGNRPLRRPTYSQLRQQTGPYNGEVGRPRAMTVNNGQLLFYPTPSEATSCEIITGRKFVAMEKDDDVPPIPDDRRSALFWGALAMAKSNDHEQTTEWAKYQDIVNKMALDEDNNNEGYAVQAESDLDWDRDCEDIYYE